MNEEQRRLTFVIGGLAAPKNPFFRKRADRKVSLSPLTFTMT